MAHFVERLKPRRKWLAMLLAGGVACFAGWWWLTPRDQASSPPARDGFVEQTAVVARRPFSASIGFTGTIVAGDAIGIFAPFDGTVKMIGFTYGDQVAAGQILVELDTSELQQNRNDAESAFLKASQASVEMAGWDSGPDVSRARRAVISAEASLHDTDRKIQETKELLDKGLVPRSEYEGLTQQRRSLLMSVEAAQEDLVSTINRGRGGNRRVVELTLVNAQARLRDLNRQSNAATIRTQDDGTIVRPPAAKMQGDNTGIRLGMRLSKGQAIGSIARAGGLGVTFRIDEGDINQLKPGLPVTVTGPGFGGVMLKGKIFSVAGEADDGGTGKPGFAVVARLDTLTPEQARQVRIGMTANIAMVTYNNDAALVVPPQAVQGVAPTATVHVRDEPGSAARAVVVQVGRVSSDGVEILSGLKGGETVVWSMPGAPALPPAP